MKRLPAMALVVWSLVLVGFVADAGAARGRRLATRRNCVGVTHQPCGTATLRAPQSREAVDTYSGCACAFYLYAELEGYNMYYAVDFHPTCSTGYWCSMDGIFDTSNSDPCPTCPTNQCVGYTYNASVEPSGRHFKPGTKLERKLKWNEALALQSGTAKGRIAGKERSFEIEAKELADARMLVSFTSDNTMYYAKLHLCRIESQEIGGAKTATVSDFAVGQEIEAPPADQKVRDVTNQVTIVDDNVARIRIGATTYQVVTATPLSH